MMLAWKYAGRIFWNEGKRFVKELDICAVLILEKKNSIRGEARNMTLFPYLEVDQDESDDYTENEYRHHIHSVFKNPNAGSHFKRIAQMIARCCGVLDVNPEKQEQLFQRREVHSTALKPSSRAESKLTVLLQQALVPMDTTISVVQMEQILEEVGSIKYNWTSQMAGKFRNDHEECSFERTSSFQISRYILEKPEDTCSSK